MLKCSSCCLRGKGKLLLSPQQDYPHRALKNKGIVDSGCSRHMTGNKAYLAEYQDFNGGPVAFGLVVNVLHHEFKNKDVIEFCGSKGIKREYSNARTPQQNRVAERKNRTLIEICDQANNHAGQQKANHNAGTEDIVDAGDSEKEDESTQDCFSAVADFTNLETVVNVSPIPTSRINSSHPSALILGDPTSAVQTRSKVHKSSGAHAFVSYVQKQRRNNHKDFQHCLFADFLSQNATKKI
ncbi:putative ribonuclease H-like domain-containing protein [Tanacetum coccineum]